MPLLLAACSPTYTRGCSTKQESVVTRGSITMRELANPYRAAKGKRWLRWCEIEVGGRPLVSPEGTRAAQMCSVSPAPDVEAVTYAWQHANGTSGGFLLDLTGGRHEEHPLHGSGTWIAGGHLYACADQVFDLVRHAVHEFPARVRDVEAAPDGGAVLGRGERTERAIPVFVMRLPGGQVETRTLVNAEHRWIAEPSGRSIAFDQHVHWARQPDGTWSFTVDP